VCAKKIEEEEEEVKKSSLQKLGWQRTSEAPESFYISSSGRCSASCPGESHKD